MHRRRSIALRGMHPNRGTPESRAHFRRFRQPMPRFASQCPDVSPNRAQSVQCRRSWDVLQTSFRCTRARPLRRQLTDRLRLLTIYGWGADRQCPLPSPVFNRLDAEVPQAPRASSAPLRHCTPCWTLPGPHPSVTARIVIAVASRLLLSA